MILDIKIDEKSYDKKKIVLDRLSFSLKKKEIICLIGPSGCGKSTILNILGQLDKNFRGNLKFYLEAQTAYMFQNDNLFSWKNILENVRYGLDLQKIPREKANKRALAVLTEINLEHTKQMFPSELSGGMRQRIALARVMVMQPNLLLLDEPLSHLDTMSKTHLTSLLVDFIKDNNMGAIIVTHSLEEASLLADRVIVLSSMPTSIKKDIDIRGLSFDERVKLLLETIKKEHK